MDYVLNKCFLCSVSWGLWQRKLNWVSCFCFRGQAEKEFKVEVEAIGRVRHKNLVR